MSVGIRLGGGKRAVVIDLSVRRLCRSNSAREKVTFVEQVPGLTLRYQRRTFATCRRWSPRSPSPVCRAATGEGTEVLPDLRMQTVTAWLKAHPGVEMVCRDAAA